MKRGLVSLVAGSLIIGSSFARSADAFINSSGPDYAYADVQIDGPQSLSLYNDADTIKISHTIDSLLSAYPSSGVGPTWSSDIVPSTEGLSARTGSMRRATLNGLFFSIKRGENLWNIAKSYGVREENLAHVVNYLVEMQEDKNQSESFLRRIVQDNRSVIDGRVVKKSDGIRGDTIWPEDTFLLSPNNLEILSLYGWRKPIVAKEADTYELSESVIVSKPEKDKDWRMPVAFTLLIGSGLALGLYGLSRRRTT